MSLVKSILRSLSKAPESRVRARGLDGSARALLAFELMKEGRCPVLVGSSASDAEELYRDLAFLLGSTDDEARSKGLFYLGADEKSAYEEYSPEPLAVMERLATLYSLAMDPARVEALVVSPSTFARKLIPSRLFSRGGDYVVSGARLDRQKLLRDLVSWGYSSVSSVEDPGTFSLRGGIVDVFSPNLSKPIRIDLFGDEIESIRSFDPSNQRTLETLEDALILPAREIVFTDEVVKTACEQISALGESQLVPTKRLRAVLDDVENRIFFFGVECLLPLFHPEGLVTLEAYAPKADDVVWIIPDPGELEEAWARHLAEEELARAKVLAHHGLALPVESHSADGSEVLGRALDRHLVIELPRIGVTDTAIPEVAFPVSGHETLRAEILKATRDEDQAGLEPLVTRLRRWRSAGIVNVLVAGTRGQAERLKSLLSTKERGLQVRLREKRLDLGELTSTLRTGGTLADRSFHAHIVIGELSRGLLSEGLKLCFVTEEEIFGQRQKKHKKRAPAAGAFVSDLADLKPGDFVVHLDFGIGLYHGLTRLPVNGVDGDFLFLEYKGGDKLYLPVTQLRLVQKYASAEEGRNPVLSKLGAPTWTNTKRKVKDTLLQMASELLRLYAVRSSVEVQPIEGPGEAYARFESDFAFEPTVDQQKAFDDVVRDVQLPKPMDRLICGDVGYGKTEVAMRAAALVVLSKRQVAVLVPTTVLAAQHFNVFKERFAGFPDVRIEVVSRFQSNEEIKKTLAGVAAGQVDIVIGTHRLLSKDVKFPRLGLLVLDEEHRFGVKHKEQLKKYRTEVHVLAMSATPIPRTLHLGFMGVRDMSLIATPPDDRQAVRTEVHRFSEDVIRDALLNEIRRGGQCFVVHNRVASIDAFARFIHKLVPEARIGVGHGQMDEEDLEKVMVDFMEKRHNILISTTIIESGIDIANANTILINRADRLGLAQLYQLKGRVGRSKNRGFAYFLIPVGNLTADAKKRIAVLQRFAELGAGFKVASHDLEIRGAGNLLGKEQHGQIQSVGFEMYQHLLKEAIEELKGAAQKAAREPEVRLPVPALIPDVYVPPPGERLSYYQRLNRAESDEDTYDILQELTDLYGAPPPEVENLVQLMRVKQRLGRVSAINLEYGPPTKNMPPRLVIRFDDREVKLSGEQLASFLNRKPGSRKMIPDGRIMLYLNPFTENREVVVQSIELLDELILKSLSRDTQRRS
ncbi:MAG: transcription-repair coupling factor [Deltaproteobacteria bacterium]|nr:transcription-repair coupling factor [Deltaproteobacteria bacterium]